MAENFESFQNNPLQNSTYTLEQQNAESEGARSQGLSNRDTDAKQNDLEREPEQMQMLRQEIQEAIAALKKENADLRLEIEEYVKLLMTDRFANNIRYATSSTMYTVYIKYHPCPCKSDTLTK